jgi:hypothetical protein
VRRGTTLAVGLALALVACGKGEPAQRDPLLLLKRRPDLRFEHPGALVPDAAQGWGAAAGPGWARFEEDDRLTDGRPALRANQPTATLLLQAPARADRELELEAWIASAVEGSAGSLAVRLNGVELGVLTLTGTPTTQRLDAPAAAWNPGENVLELEVPRLRVVDGAGPEAQAWDTLAVARVGYGTERRVVLDPATGRLELPDTTGLRYLVEAREPASVELVGSGDGTLTLRVGATDARTGALGESVGDELAVRGRVERALRLPPTDSGPHFVELSWRGTAGPFRIERLEVVEEEPVPRPPVVLVSIDTLSARHMSVHGYARETTPELEAFAADAVVFERCIANAPWTLPSYLSVLTGLYPRAHFVELEYQPGLALDNNDFWQLAGSRWTLAETLRARGYQTAASVDTMWLAPTFNVDQGFDLYDIGPAAE